MPATFIFFATLRKDVDARDKPGHDELIDNLVCGLRPSNCLLICPAGAPLDFVSSPRLKNIPVFF
jgi:hypothetical protein